MELGLTNAIVETNETNEPRGLPPREATP
jgi:hypothetical protein